MIEWAFIAANLTAVIGWSFLLLRRKRSTQAVRLARYIAFCISLGYLSLLPFAFDGLAGLASNYTVEGIGPFFDDPVVRLFGWTHYLAFDLWVGTWEVEEADRVFIPIWTLRLVLILTLLIGPVGLVAFLLVRCLFRPTIGPATR